MNNNKNAQKGNERASSFLHCRVMPKDKALFVKMSMREDLKLCEWIMNTLRKECADNPLQS